MEIWSQNGTFLERRIVPPSILHGAVSTDTEWFGIISWNPQETAIVYLAEMNPPSTVSLFQPSNKNSDEVGDAIVGGDYTLGLGKGENWGEKYVSTSGLHLFYDQCGHRSH